MVVILGVATGAAALAQAPGPLTLEHALTIVASRSPQRQGAAAMVDSARTGAGFAGAWPNPAVEVRAENWTFGSWRWTPSLDPTASPALDAFVVVSQPVKWSGKRAARRNAARAATPSGVITPAG